MRKISPVLTLNGAGFDNYPAEDDYLYLCEKSLRSYFTLPDDCTKLVAVISDEPRDPCVRAQRVKHLEYVLINGVKTHVDPSVERFLGTDDEVYAWVEPVE